MGLITTAYDVYNSGRLRRVCGCLFNGGRGTFSIIVVSRTDGTAPLRVSMPVM